MANLTSSPATASNRGSRSRPSRRSSARKSSTSRKSAANAKSSKQGNRSATKMVDKSKPPVENETDPTVELFIKSAEKTVCALTYCSLIAIRLASNEVKLRAHRQIWALELWLKEYEYCLKAEG
jgi:hypothetical protein